METGSAVGSRHQPSTEPWTKTLKKIVLVLAIVGGLIGLLAYGFTRDPRDIPSPLIGRKAPPFNLTLFDGGRLAWDDLQGKVVLVNFWASWCIPCRDEAPLLEAAWKWFKQNRQDVIFVGIDIQDRETDARAFLKEFGVTYANGPDPTGKIAIDYGVYGVPETFFIEKTGRITYKHVGALNAKLLADKLGEALQGVASGREGRGDYQPAR